MRPAWTALLGVGLGILVLTQHAGGFASRPGADPGVAVGGNAPIAEAPKIPAVSFRKDIAPVLAASCSTRSCHGSGIHSPALTPGVDPSKIRLALVGVAAEERPDRHYVEPSDPTKSFLVDKIEGHLVDAECADGDCGRRMPSRNAPLPDVTRAMIRSWIAQGALDN